VPGQGCRDTLRQYSPGEVFRGRSSLADHPPAAGGEAMIFERDWHNFRAGRMLAMEERP